MIHALFSWPGGGVWGNLVSSLIWAAPAGLLAARKLRRMHAHILDLHRRLDLHQSALTAALQAGGERGKLE